MHKNRLCEVKLECQIEFNQNTHTPHMAFIVDFRNNEKIMHSILHIWIKFQPHGYGCAFYYYKPWVSNPSKSG